ncbi:MAG: bile acid:sodium symporter family protein [Nitrospirota bacterium]
MQKIAQWLSRNIFQLVLLALLCGYSFPIAPAPALRTLVLILFAYMTFITSLATSFQDFLSVVRRPKIPLYILSIVHIGTPVTAWIIGIIFFPDDPLIRIGYLITAGVPVAITSVIWTDMVKGNMPVSLVTVTLDTLIAPVLLPLYILFVVGVTIDIPYGKMTFDLLLMITLPSILGMLVYDRTGGKTKQYSEGIAGILSRLALFGIIFLNSAFVSSSIVGGQSIVKILIVTSLVVAVGYGIGFVAGKIVRVDQATTFSIMYCTGMRNIAIGLVIATGYFPPETAVPVGLGMLFQQPFAALTARIYRSKQSLQIQHPRL